MKKFFFVVGIFTLMSTASVALADITSFVSISPATITSISEWNSAVVSFHNDINDQNTIYVFDGNNNSMFNSDENPNTPYPASASPVYLTALPSSTAPYTNGTYTLINNYYNKPIDQVCGLGTTLAQCNNAGLYQETTFVVNIAGAPVPAGAPAMFTAATSTAELLAQGVSAFLSDKGLLLLLVLFAGIPFGFWIFYELLKLIPREW